MIMHHNRRCEFGSIQAKEKIFYIDLLAIRLFPFVGPRLQRQVKKERDIPLSRNSSSVPGVPTRRSTGDSRPDFKILCGKGNCNNNQGQGTRHKHGKTKAN